MKSLIAVLLFSLAGTASAANVAMKPPVGITGNPASASGWTTATNFVGSFSAASFNAPFVTNVGGKTVTMPATMRLAANAGQFAVAAVRSSPAALLGSAVVAWLLSNGMQYIDGQWMTNPNKPDIVGGGWVISGFQGKVAPAETTFDACVAAYTGNQFGFIRCEALAHPTFRIYLSDRTIYNSVVQVTSCPTGYKWVSSSNSCVPTPIPATQAAWDNVAASPLSDAAATELATAGNPVPLQNPDFDPDYVDVPLGEPYVDPVTGKRYQDGARVTPHSDGKTADVQTKKQEVDEEGDPATDPTTGVEAPPEKQDEFCKQNPDSIACMEKGETDELDLETRSIGGMVSPIAVGGAGHCMADKTLALATMGRSITFTYKPICDLASMVRPLILALAWLLAGWIMIGAVKEN